jgi:hypothetical protein
MEGRATPAGQDSTTDNKTRGSRFQGGHDGIIVVHVSVFTVDSLTAFDTRGKIKQDAEVGQKNVWR